MSKGTKDTKFVLALYDLAKESGDVFSPLNRYVVGEKAGIKARGVNAICKLLIQANFIKKEDEEAIYITDHGVSLVKEIRNLT